MATMKETFLKELDPRLEKQVENARQFFKYESCLYDRRSHEYSRS